MRFCNHAQSKIVEFVRAIQRQSERHVFLIAESESGLENRIVTLQEYKAKLTELKLNSPYMLLFQDRIESFLLNSYKFYVKVLEEQSGSSKYKSSYDNSKVSSFKKPSENAL